MLKRLSTLFLFALATPLLAADLPTHPYPPVTYSHTTQTNPPQEIFSATIDLTSPDVHVRVSRGGPDPDGQGPWTTTLMRPTKVADREHFDIVVNGDFFEHANGKDAEGAAAQKEFKASTMAKVHGTAETDGVVWSHAEKPSYHLLSFDHLGHPSISKGTDPPSSSFQAIGVHDILVHDSKNVAPDPSLNSFNKGPHPRTAVGYKDNGKTLILVVVDGRTKISKGMSLQELADVLLKLGATEAVNLDGGGSSVLAIRDPQSHKMQILNHPSDGAERSVGNVLGISLTPLPK